MPDLNQRLRVIIDAQNKTTTAFNRLKSDTETTFGKAPGGGVSAAAAAKGQAGSAKGLIGSGLATAAAFGGVTLGIGAMVGGFKNVISTAASFQRAMSQVKAISGANSEEFEQLTAIAKEMGANTRYSASEAAEGLKFLSMAGLEVNETLTALPQMLSLASAGALGLGEAADISTNILAGMGMNVEDLSHVADGLSEAARSSNTNVQELGEAFSYGAAQAKSVGVKYDELTAVFGQLANAGIKGSAAGTSFAMAITKMLDPSEDAADIIDRLGLQFLDAQGNMRPMVDILDDLERASLTAQEKLVLFGTRGQRAMSALMTGGRTSLQALYDKIKESDGVSAEMARTMEDNFEGAVLKFDSAMESLKISVGTWLLPAATEVAGWATNMVGDVNRVAEAAEDLSESEWLPQWLKDAVSTTAGAGKSLAFGSWILPLVDAAVEGGVQVGEGLKAGFDMAETAAFGVVDVVAGTDYSLQKKLEMIASQTIPEVNAAVRGIKTEFETVSPQIQALALQAISPMEPEVRGLKDTWEYTLDGIQTVTETKGPGITKGLKIDPEGIVPDRDSLASALENRFSNAFEQGLGNLIRTGDFGSFLSTIGNSILDGMIGGLAKSITSSFMGLFTGGGTGGTSGGGVFGAIGKLFGGTGEGTFLGSISKALPYAGLVAAGLTFGKPIAEGIGNAIGKVAGAVGGIFSSGEDQNTPQWLQANVGKMSDQELISKWASVQSITSKSRRAEMKNILLIEMEKRGMDKAKGLAGDADIVWWRRAKQQGEMMAMTNSGGTTRENDPNYDPYSGVVVGGEVVGDMGGAGGSTGGVTASASSNVVTGASSNTGSPPAGAVRAGNGVSTLDALTQNLWTRAQMSVSDQMPAMGLTVAMERMNALKVQMEPGGDFYQAIGGWLDSGKTPGDAAEQFGNFFQAMFGVPFASFQHGGSFRVPGMGGADSQLVSFMASPGEQVTVEPPTSGFVGGGSRGGSVNLYFNVTLQSPDRNGSRALIEGEFGDLIIQRLRRDGFAGEAVLPSGGLLTPQNL